MKLDETKKTKTKKATVKETEPKVKTIKKDENEYEDKIASWKSQYGKIYKNTIDNETIIWRAIRRGEYKKLLDADKDVENTELRLFLKQEETVKIAVLYPENINDLIEQKAGLATVLSEEILARSGFALSETETL